MTINQKPNYMWAFNAIVEYLTTQTEEEENEYSIKKDPLINFQQRLWEKVNEEMAQTRIERKEKAMDTEKTSKQRDATKETTKKM